MLADTARWIARVRAGAEAREGLTAFLERRKPGVDPRPMKIARLLIANRGEIACRVIRTCRRLGIRAIAVHSDADRDALHVRLADEAHAIGPAPARESYLDADAVIAAARAARADAIHPGYGFLSENAAFAEACAAAGITFVGPPPAAIRAMGLKHEAKALVSAAGVPVVPGYMGEDQSPARLAAEAERVGFPLLVKAVAGGGGKGMRVVREAGGARRGDPRRARRGRERVRRRTADARALPRAAAARGGPGVRRHARRAASTSSSANAPCSGVTRRSSRKRPRPSSTRRPAPP